MAEAYADAGSMADAVKAYEKVAYEYKDAGKGSEAGYSALIILDQLVKVLRVKRKSSGKRTKLKALFYSPIITLKTAVR